MFHKKTLLILLVVGVILIAGVSITSAFAGDGFKHWGFKANLTEEQKAEMLEKKQAFNNALENNDFTAWQELMGDKPMAEKTSEEYFAKMVENYQAMQDGDYETVKHIKQGMGFAKHGFKGDFTHEGFKDVNGDGVCDYMDKQVEE